MKMQPKVRLYQRVQYAGSLFRTEQSQARIKHDDSIIRADYISLGQSGRRSVKRAYGRVTRIILHEAYPGGPTRVIFEGRWFESMGTCNVAGTALVRWNDNYHMNSSARFAFIESCYPRPLAMWPHDPLDQLPQENVRKTWFDIIDRNQDEEA